MLPSTRVAAQLPSAEPSKKQRLRPWLFVALPLLLALMLGTLIWLAVAHHSGWNQLIAWAMKTQTQLHKGLTAAMRAVGDEGWMAALPLIGLSFLYGIFHAAGPGHGKAVMTAYLGTHVVHARRGLVLSTLAALLQGVVAVVLVEVVIGVMGQSLRRANHAGGQLENASYALVALLGVILASRSGWALWQRVKVARQSTVFRPGGMFAGGGKMRMYCADCGGLHDLASGHQKNKSWRTELMTVVSIGIRPCTGAILILLVAHAIGLRWAGMAAVLAMSIGTAITVGLMAVGTVWFRKLLFRTNPSGAGIRHGAILESLGVIGGLLILAFGLSLLRSGMATAPHPLL